MAVRVQLQGPPPAHAVHPLEGFGAQFNTNIFRDDGQPTPLTESQHDALRSTIKNLNPGHSRIFVSRPLVATPHPPAKELDAFLNTVELAEQAGANVNLTFWGQGPYAGPKRLAALTWPHPEIRDWPSQKEQHGEFKWPPQLMTGQLTAPAALMHNFARIIAAARLKGPTCIKYATIQNEPNGAAQTDLAKQGNPGLSMRLYEWLYRRLDEALRHTRDPLHPDDTSVNLRHSIKLIGGDLVLGGNSPQDDWLRYLRNNMEVPRKGFPCVLDGYSIHVYWAPGDGPMGFPQRLEQRLTRLPGTLKEIGIEGPLYVTEYGVRKVNARPEPAGAGSGQTIEFSPEVAFQHAWFNALAPQYGCVGLAKWVLYRTDATASFGEWGMIDAPNPPVPRTSFGRSPAYRMTRLFNHLVGPGWTAAGLGQSQDGTVLASKFSDGASDESVAVLNRGDKPQQVLVAGLKPTTAYFAGDWNRDGKGTIQTLPPVTSGSDRVAPVNVPRHGLVALSTQPLQL